MPNWDDGDFERGERHYRERVSRRYAALRLAHRDREKRARLRALRRLQERCCEAWPYCGHTPKPRANRRPAIVLALIFVVLIGALYLVARAGAGEVRRAAYPGALPPTSSATLVARLDPHTIRSTICAVFTGTRCGPAIRVAKCETGGTFNPRALGSAGERGLFQIHPVHFRRFDRRRLFEALYNVRAAFRLSRGGRDWSPWSCQP